MFTDSDDQKINSFLTFRLDDEVYAVNASNIMHILEMQNITHVPKAPAYMLGVINLRGTVLPVIDTRKKFELADKEFTPKTCILVLELVLEKQNLIIGTVVDEVDEVIEIQEQDIKPSPAIGDRYHADFIEGVAIYDDHFIMILNLENLLTAREVKTLSRASEFKGKVEQMS
ncbi:MAG: chemotaxis protein CheW [Bacteroidales bacterium]|nr:chemotaxis protein CheW [Bacteroidales bacterium]